MSDYLIRGIDQVHNFRILACDSTLLSEEARVMHDMWPTAAAALSRTLSVGVMMGSMLKGEKEHLNIEIAGGGAIGKIFVDARQSGTVRGFVGDPHVQYIYNDTNKLAVGVAVGKDGYLKVVKDMRLKSEFAGQVPLVSGEIGEDFAYYFTVSEQTPSAVSVGCLVDENNAVIAAGGILIQLLPDALEEDIVFVEEALAKLPPVSDMIVNHESVETMMKRISDTIEILESKPVHYECGCSRERMEEALFTLTNQEREEMIEQNDGCEICCHFCSAKYQFDSCQLQAMNDENLHRFRTIHQSV